MTDTTRSVPGPLPDPPVAVAVARSDLIHTDGTVDDLALSGLARSSSERTRGALDALTGLVENSGGDAAGILRTEPDLASPDDLPAWGLASKQRWRPGAPTRTTLITQPALLTLAVGIQAVAAVSG
jgi:hypothetical protein